MAMNFGLLNTNIPADIGAMPGNALAARRQRIQQDEDRAMGREQAQMTNALSRMQLTKAQGDMDEEAAYKNALRGVQGGNYEQAMPDLLQASPSRALALQKQLGETKKGDMEMTLKRFEIIDRAAGQFAANPTRQSAMQSLQMLQSIGTPPEVLQQMQARLEQTPDEQLPQLAREFLASTQEGIKAQTASLFPKAAAPSNLAQLIAERDALPPGDPRRTEYDRAISKTTTHAPAASMQVNMTQEKEESKAVGKGLGEQFMDIQRSGIDAGSKIARFDRLGQLLEGVSTGKLTPATTQVAALAQSLGLNIDDSLPAKQAAEALSNEIALQLRNPSGGAGMPGALSDKDREFLVGMTPGLAKTPEGNRLIIDTAKKLAKRDQDVAKIARDYRKKNGSIDEGFYDELAAYAEKNPLFKATPSAAASPRAPAAGTVQSGYRFRGGNPADPKNWDKVQ